MMCGVCAACIVIMNMNMGALATETDDTANDAEQVRYETVTVQEGTLIARMNTHIRSGAGTQYDILTSMKPGETCEVLGAENGWYHIRYGIIKGYIAGEYLSVRAYETQIPYVEPTPMPTAMEGYRLVEIVVGTVMSTKSINLRAGAGEKHEILMQLAPLEACTVLRNELGVPIEENEWYQVQAGDVTGYIAKEHLELSIEYIQVPLEEGETVRPDETVTLAPGYELSAVTMGTVISQNKANVRSGAGEDFEIIGQLLPGERCTVVREVDDDWYWIEFEGKEAYVAHDSLSISIEYVAVPVETPVPIETPVPAQPETPVQEEPDVEPGYELKEVQVGTIISQMKVNLRKGAGTNYEAIVQLAPGTTFIVIGEEGDWYQADVDGKVGYVTKEYVSVGSEMRTVPVSTPTPEPAETPELTIEPTVEPTAEPTIEPGYERREVQVGTVISKMKVNLRKGAGTDYGSITQVAPGTTFIVIGEEGDWYRVELNGEIGYITKEYVSVVREVRVMPIPTPTPEPTETPEPIETPVPTQTAAPGHELREVDAGTVIASAVVSMREKADVNSAVIAYIAPGKTCIVLDDEREWYEVEFDGYTGYIAKEYLSVERKVTQIPLFTPSPAPTDDPNTEYETVEKLVATVTANAKTNVRAGAGTDYDIVLRLEPGETCFVIGEEGSWYEVEKDGRHGYISKEFVKVALEEVRVPVSTPSPTPTAVPVESERPSAAEGFEWVERMEGTLNAKMETNVRQGPGTGYGIVTRMEPGDTCKVLAREGDWYRIEYQGVKGYIAAEYISTRTYEELVEIIVEDPLDALLVNAQVPNVMYRGETHSLKGIIDSNIPITGVTVTIENLRTMSIEMSASMSIAHDENVTEFDLMQLDGDLKFRRLKAGEKRITVTVSSANDEQVVLNRMLYVIGSVDSMDSITADCKFSSKVGRADRAKDGRYATAWESGAAGDTLSIAVPDKYSSETITVEWVSAPKSFELVLNGVAIAVDNTDERIHFTFATGGASEIEIRVGEAKDSISEVRVYEQERTPDILQDWQVPGDKVDMMVIVAHQGDEFLYFGGAIPQAVSEGKEVLVVYMADCGRDRYAEAMNGLWAVGVRTHPVFLGMENGNPRAYEDAIEMWGLEESYEIISEVLRRYKPDVVLTHDINGEDGNNQRKLTSATVRRAILLASDEGVYTETAQLYGAWDVPKTYVHLYEANVVTVDIETPLAGLNGWTAEEGFRVGLYKNSSLEDVRIKETYVSEDGTEYSMHSFGLIRTNVGYDEQKNSFFENIPEAEGEAEADEEAAEQ